MPEATGPPTWRSPTPRLPDDRCAGTARRARSTRAPTRAEPTVLLRQGHARRARSRLRAATGSHCHALQRPQPCAASRAQHSPDRQAARADALAGPARHPARRACARPVHRQRLHRHRGGAGRPACSSVSSARAIRRRGLRPSHPLGTPSHEENRDGRVDGPTAGGRSPAPFCRPTKPSTPHKEVTNMTKAQEIYEEVEKRSRLGHREGRRLQGSWPRRQAAPSTRSAAPTTATSARSRAARVANPPDQAAGDHAG